MDRSPPQDALPTRLALLALMALAAARPAWSASGENPPSDAWRTDARFQAVESALAEWLATSPAAEQTSPAWEAAVIEAKRPARLSGTVLHLAALADERFASLCSDLPPTPPAWIVENKSPVHASLRLAMADELASRSEYDACLAWLDGLSEDALFSPALMTYLRVVALHQTIDDQAAKESLEHLSALQTESPSDSLGPARIWVIETLTEELPKEAKSLPVIARRMRDVERRLALSQADEPTIERHETILKELDELLDKLEKQRQQQQQQANQSSQGGGSAPGDPAEESRPSELKGPGEVDRKRLVAGDAWGSLPPAERARLTQAITRDFPPHYRALVEDYFRTLAAEADTAQPAPTDE